MKAEGLTHKEIGIELGISKSSVSKKISRSNKLKSLEDTNQK